MKLLTRRGVLVEERGQTYIADNEGDSDEARTLRPLQAAACTYRIAFGLRAAHKALTVQGIVPRRWTSSTRCAPACRVSACTPRCAAGRMTARRWSNCAATSPDRPWPMTVCNATPLAHSF